MTQEHLRLVCTKRGTVEAHPHRVRPPCAATVGERERGKMRTSGFQAILLPCAGNAMVRTHPH
jgi:hypothetical protein